MVFWALILFGLFAIGMWIGYEIAGEISWPVKFQALSE